MNTTARQVLTEAAAEADRGARGHRYQQAEWQKLADSSRESAEACEARAAELRAEIAAHPVEPAADDEGAGV